VNYDSIFLTDEQLGKYNAFLESSRIGYVPWVPGMPMGQMPKDEDFERAADQAGVPRDTYSAMTLAEKKAVNLYTQNLYEFMNKLARCDVDGAIASWRVDVGLEKAPGATEDEIIKQGLLHLCVAISGLNKIPDFINPTGSKFLYRTMELDNEPAAAFVRERAELSLQRGISREPFMSTSVGIPVLPGQVSVLVRNVGGKDVRGLSAMGSTEAEILIPSKKVQWLYYRYDPNPEYDSSLRHSTANPKSIPGQHFIIGRPV